MAAFRCFMVKLRIPYEEFLSRKIVMRERTHAAAAPRAGRGQRGRQQRVGKNHTRLPSFYRINVREGKTCRAGSAISFQRYYLRDVRLPATPVTRAADHLGPRGAPVT